MWWKEKGTAHDTMHTTSSLEHGGGSVMVWTCMNTPEMGSLVFIDDVTAGSSSRVNSEVYSNILSAQVQQNASKTGLWFLRFNYRRHDWWQTSPESNRNWGGLQYRPGRASPGKMPNIWWSLWVTDFRQSSDLQPSNTLQAITLCSFVQLLLVPWNGGVCMKRAIIHSRIIGYGYKSCKAPIEPHIKCLISSSMFWRTEPK